MPGIEIDIISDVVCPFCYIGKSHLERAIEQTGYTPIVRWHPFELNPDIDLSGVDRIRHMTAKFGGAEAVQRAERTVTDMAVKTGITFNLDKQKVQPNTFALHKLLAFAQIQNLGNQLSVAFFDAFFVNGTDLSSIDTIITIAGEVGMDMDQCRACLEDESFAEEVRYAMESVKQTGVRSVPFFIFNGKFAISGAQPVEVFIDALHKADKEPAEKTPKAPES